MINRKLGQAVYKSLNVFGISATAFSAVFSAFGYFIGVDTKASIAWTFVAFSIPAVFFLTLIDVIKWLLEDTEIHLPKISRFPTSPHLSVRQTIVLVEQTRLLGQNMSASVFYVDDGFEILIGEGFVLTIQQDSQIQLSITYVVEGTEVFWNDIRANKASALSATIVRPGGQPKELQV